MCLKPGHYAYVLCFFLFSAFSLFFFLGGGKAKMLSCVHCKCANQLCLALGYASSVMEMWIFASAPQAVWISSLILTCLNTLFVELCSVKFGIFHFTAYILHVCVPLKYYRLFSGLCPLLT